MTYHIQFKRIILKHCFRHYFNEYYPCAALKIKHHKNIDYLMTNPTPEIEPLTIDDNNIKDDFVPPEEFDPNEPLEILRLYR